MKKTNGFTLIELLAVIAILAIILLIAVPMVLSTINSSRDSSLKSSAVMVWDAAENCVAMNTVDASLCTLPTPLTGTAKGFGSVASALYPALSSLGGFSGKYEVTMGTANQTTITQVRVTNGATLGTTYTCTITSKTGNCTFSGS